MGEGVNVRIDPGPLPGVHVLIAGGTREEVVMMID